MSIDALLNFILGMGFAKTRLSYLAIAKNTLIKLRGWCKMSWFKVCYNRAAW